MKLKGTFSPPGDKSISHRIGLMSLMAKGRTRVRNYSSCEDCATTLRLVKELGAGVQSDEEGVLLDGAGGRLNSGLDLDCGNSGTTMRLIMGILSGMQGVFTLDGDESLRKRPMERVAAPLKMMGCDVKTNEGRPPITINGGPLKGISYTLPVASAQLKSALMLAGVQAEGTTQVVEPIKTRDHTEHMLRLCGAQLERSHGAWNLTKAEELTMPGDFWVPGDISSAAFFLCAAAVLPGSDVSAERILLNSSRTGVLEVLLRMGALVEEDIQGDVPEPWGKVRVRHSPGLKGCEIEHQEIPLLVDEVPVMALVATQATGRTIFRQVGELRVKESDRLSAIVSQLGAMGADLRIDGEDLIINGPTPLKPAQGLDSFGDHRIAMTLKMAGLIAASEITPKQEECAAISYPSFFEDLKALLR
jgi:3-phosphoshikimate 1-carboxyvinyltransferase